MDNRRSISSKVFLSLPRKDRKVAIFGDIKTCPQVIHAAQNVDVLVHEATFVAGDRETAERVFHLTMSDTAKLALQANMEQLYPTHISARYIEGEQRLILEQQAQIIFPVSKVADDFSVFDI